VSMIAHLVTFRPLEESPLGMRQSRIRELARRSQSAYWRFYGHRQVSLGDRVYLLMQGKRGPAIIGYGATDGQPVKEDEGWVVPIRFRRIVSASDSPLASEPELRRLWRKPGLWNTQRSGIRVPQPIAEALESIVVGDAARGAEDGEEQQAEAAADAAERDLRRRKDLGPREKKVLVKARRGQGAYRERLLEIEKSCRITGLSDPRHLRASHMKPWIVCSDAEKLDGSNGLLLSPHIDHLFDRGYITFSARGELLISRELDPRVLRVWGVDRVRSAGTFTARQRKYLAYHRHEVFRDSKRRRR